ncbi:hypothetical protein DL766_005228 [Monosporascus sp. MC13-8B]|uniref:tRNA dimethylallyltransferase n=1 Tax=Monosporascus cannonballus TaxID=155416 RepID=A0ABY0GQ33_9PEZI|nr:hypothetical protein DL762_010360 [Monosporascus cannonballus]RYO89574.1 hypothetical protein DL763_005602 [Monosporascus cannonballus]RYP29737.1 hypothetical protein DL766_005228 [Monosporascus sp. MC13-8B]
MSTSRRPLEPLVAVMGSTGTGKSDLAVDLALRFNGEIINADAMQMYRGLPVITNQISAEERKGVPHHLLAIVDHHEPTWTVLNFATEARKVVQGIRSRGRLPIIVGGTHYYLNALLFEDSVLGPQSLGDDNPRINVEDETSAQFPILNAHTDVLMNRLREVDPAMASRWHPSERRKIQRSLEIYLTTGKRASDIYAEQQRDRLASRGARGPWETLMFWVYSKPDVLYDRLNRRIDKMVGRGLMAEVEDLHGQLRRRTDAGETVDRTKGIWQSIGFKQLEPLLNAKMAERAAEELERLKDAGLEQMRAATRQYARAQIKWLRGKTVPKLEEHDALKYLYLLDSSHAENFATDVLHPAADICRQFLEGEDMSKPSELSDTARDVLGAFADKGRSPRPALRQKTCEACHMTVLESEWEKHVKGRRHRRILKHKGRTALVPFEGEASAEFGSGHTFVEPQSRPPSVNLGDFP